MLLRMLFTCSNEYARLLDHCCSRPYLHTFTCTHTHARLLDHLVRSDERVELEQVAGFHLGADHDGRGSEAEDLPDEVVAVAVASHPRKGVLGQYI